MAICISGIGLEVPYVEALEARGGYLVCAHTIILQTASEIKAKPVGSLPTVSGIEGQLVF